MHTHQKAKRIPLHSEYNYGVKLYTKKSYMPTGEDVAPETDMVEEDDDDDRLYLEKDEDEMEETFSFE